MSLKTQEDTFTKLQGSGHLEFMSQYLTNVPIFVVPCLKPKIVFKKLYHSVANPTQKSVLYLNGVRG